MSAIAYIAKKVLSTLLLPIGLCLLLLFPGLVCLRRTRRRRLGLRLLWIAAIWLLMTSLPITAYFIMRPLEARAGPCVDPEILNRLSVRHIVVLGGESPGHPRVAEAIRLWRRLPGADIILSEGRLRYASAAQRFAADMGVPGDALITARGAYDTADEAGLIAGTVGKRPFALVTSAYHIPRAMKLFRARGLNPVPSPCEHRTKDFPQLVTCLLPSADALLTTQLALHEYLGLALYSLKEYL